MDVKFIARLLLFTPAILMAACSSTPEIKPTVGSVALPIVPETKIQEAPSVKTAPEQYQVHTTEADTRAGPKIIRKPLRSKTTVEKAAPKTLPPKTTAVESALTFDIPVAYNPRVAYWVGYFQTTGHSWYEKWLERSSRYLPLLQTTLSRHGLPKDLAYIAMIESGFSSQASSTAKAVGPWQFIRETGQRYGLKVAWWIDERRDFQKSTDAAAKYLKRLYGMFHNWYLVAASYNTGENRIKHAIAKHGTKNFWKITHLETETMDYVPKLIAALLIAKSPSMYGFRNIKYSSPLDFETFRVPGGTRLPELATAIGVTPKVMRDLNPELTREYVPNYINGHIIRIPKGSSQLVSLYFRRTFVSER